MPPPVPPGWQQNPQPQAYAPPGYGAQGGYQAGAAAAPVGATLQYATPFGMGQTGAGVWRDGNKLVTTVQASLPRHCVKCGAPADGAYGPRTFYWYHPAIFLLLLVNLLVFAIVALIIRKKATLEVGLCAAHRSRRAKAITAAWVLVLLGLATMIGGGVAGAEYSVDWLIPVAILAGLAMWIAAAVVGTVWGAYLTPTKIDKQYGYFKGAGLDFLNLFPPVR